MPYDDILCSWLIRSALVSLTILLIGSGAVLIWRQPLRRVRIIELVLAGCLIAPWLGLIPGYPQISVVRSQATAIKHYEAPLAPTEPMIEPTMTEPMPLPTLDRAAPPVPETKPVEAPGTIEAPAHAFEIRPWIVGIYLAGVAIAAGWWLVGIVGLVRLLWTSQPAPSRCRELLTEISGGRGDRVRLLVNRRLSQPFASAWGRAVIVLPENLCGDEQTLRWCLAHEWAHVDGHDFRTWLLAGLARVLFFYQPLLWWLRRQLRLCQDFVADSQAARHAPEVEDYAEFLTARATAGRLHPALGLSMACRKSELYRRVIMLLKNESLESRTPRLWTVSVTVAALVLVAVVAAVSLVPKAVAEEKAAASQISREVSPTKDASSQPTSPGNSDLGKLFSLWDTRKNAISTASINARLFRKGRSGVNHLLSSKEIGVLVQQYKSTTNPTQGLETLIRGLRPRSLENESFWGEISFSTDGKRIAERSIYRIVKDGRADVVDRNGSVQIYAPFKCRYGTLNLESFAIELRGLDKTKLQLTRRENGLSMVTLATPDGRTIQIEVDDKTGIVRRYATLVKDQLVSEVYQLGVFQCPGGIVFPAVVFQADYSVDRLISAQVLSPTSIKVNEELSEEIFKVAQSKGSVIIDLRKENEAHSVEISEDAPDVVGYLLEKKTNNPIHAPPSPLTKCRP